MSRSVQLLQVEHSAAPGRTLYVPAKHAVQTKDVDAVPTLPYLPAVQEIHIAEVGAAATSP